MKQNKNNELPKYEDTFKKLTKSLNEYLKVSDGRKIKNFSFNQKTLNTDGFENRLIETGLNPNELLDEIKDSYLRRDYLEGEIGTIDGEEQYDGIFNMTLYMLISNRLAKHYAYEIKNNSNLDVSTKEMYDKKIKYFMSEKRSALTELISSLYIYKETENDNDFFYGHFLDINDADAFVIDLPAYGQIAVHFGSNSNLEHVQHLALQNVQLILKRKLEQGQITKNQYNEIMQKSNNTGILPEYSGKLYEHSSAIPLDYQGRNFVRTQKDLCLSKKLITDYDTSDIERISRNKIYNSRELYYWAIRSDFSKQQLEKLSALLQERDAKALNNSSNARLKHRQIDLASSESISKLIDSKSMGRKAVSETTASERKVVAEHEKPKRIVIIDNRRKGDTSR